MEIFMRLTTPRMAKRAEIRHTLKALLFVIKKNNTMSNSIGIKFRKNRDGVAFNSSRKALRGPGAIPNRKKVVPKEKDSKRNRDTHKFRYIFFDFIFEKNCIYKPPYFLTFLMLNLFKEKVKGRNCINGNFYVRFSKKEKGLKWWVSKNDVRNAEISTKKHFEIKGRNACKVKNNGEVEGKIRNNF